MEKDKKKSSFQRALSRMQDICSRKEQCAEDVIKKTAGYGLTEKELERLINSLRKDKYIDEDRYARAYINDKVKFNRWGKSKIKTMLRHKGIPDAVINDALNSILNTDYSEMIAEELRAKAGKIQYKDSYDMKAKLFRFASSRGYEPEFIYPLLDEITRDHKR